MAVRPPVVVVMGHIDHGKSQLLDYIRKSGVVENEAGGITQHIGAYEAEVKCDDGKHGHKTTKLTFLDTPGHEAFSRMRARGAKTADIAILIIASDDGVKPQTLEAYEAIKKAGIPFIVALNKIDKPEADPEKVKGQLAENQIFVERYGGGIPVANISAKTGEGVEELLDMVLLLAEMENTKANPKNNASGIVIESNLDPKRGISATLLILDGTIKKGMFVLAGNTIAPVRIFEDFRGDPMDEASFSSPVKITGFDKMPEVGIAFQTFASKKQAEKAREEMKLKERGGKKDAAEMGEQNGGKTEISVPVIIKADTSGSLEAIEKEIKKLENEDSSIEILRQGVGNVNEDDIRTAAGAEDPIILAFNASIAPDIRDMAERFGVITQSSDIIYKLSEWLEEEIKKRELLIQKEKITGKAEILKIFSKTKNKCLAGGRVIEGKISKGGKIKIKRDDGEIGTGKIIGLQSGKAEMNEVEEGKEFGAMIESKTEIAGGDTIEISEKTQ